MKSFVASLSAQALLIFQVYGHGGIYNYTIDGVDYAGHYPWLPEEGQVSPQRRWFPDPIQLTDHPFLACNRGNPLATKFPTEHAPIRAGGNITAYYAAPPCPPGQHWKGPEFPVSPGDDSPPMVCHGPEYGWVHALGPITVYMADCQGPCDQYDASGSRFFKIFESGYERGPPPYDAAGQRQNWKQAEMSYNGYTVTIPKNLKPGNYLVRHEIINLELWPPQLYPECVQVTVSGDGDKVPTEEYLVSFPGAYSDDDPGIAFAGRVYYPEGRNTFNYTIPGPTVWTGGN